MSRSKQIEAAAAEWLVRRNQGLNPADEARLQEWLRADPEHAALFQHLQSAWAAVSYPNALGRSEVALRRLASLDRRRQARRVKIWRGVSLTVAVLIVGFVSLQWRAHRRAAESSIVFWLPGRQVLPDGSKVELNRDARIEVDFSPARRGVKLLSGEAMFTVAKNAAWPFVVSAEGVEVRAVGTEFTVHCAPRQIDVTVTEGKVALKRDGDGANLLASDSRGGMGLGSDPGVQSTPVLAAGQQAVISAASVPGGAPTEAVRVRGLSASELSAALAWRQGQVKFSRTPLSEAIKVFNREGGIRIAISDPEVGRLPLSGTLQVGQPEAFVRLLEQGFGLEAARSGGVIELRRGAL